jgi:hypothetical protein
LFLCEDDLTWGKTTKKYAILITDGLDNVQGTEVPIRSGARIILVNGIASLGVLKKFNPVRFESVNACFDFISADGRR